MSWSKITTIHSETIAAGVPSTKASDEFITPQRTSDEIGILHVGIFNNTGSTGTVYLEAKLHADAPWSRVYDSVGLVSLDLRPQPNPPGGDTDLFGSAWFLNCPILPYMRAYLDAVVPGAGSDTYKITIQE